MNWSRTSKTTIAALTASALVLGAGMASAQPGYGDNGPPPPPGEYGPPPGGSAYADQQAQADAAYAQQYQAWAAQYCVNRQRNNVAAGSIIGGALGAITGAAISGGRAGGTIVGGLLGAGTGAAVASSDGPGGGCPPGYIVRAGAPGFYYGGPAIYAPVGYNPWVFVGGRYTYVPYREWYWRHHGWRGRDWRQHWHY
jgi:hypothetical protein